MNLKLIDRELVKQIPWNNDPFEYDVSLYRLGKGSDEFVVPNPNIAIDLNQIIKKSPNTDRCIVWYYDNKWIAKKFTKKWKPEYGYYDIQLPASALKTNYLWNKNPDLENIDFEYDPYRNYIPEIEESYYELVWYLDSNFCANDEKIWAVKCKNQGAQCLGTKDMGYIKPRVTIQYNPFLPKLNYNIDFKVYCWDLKYMHQWMLAREHCENAVEEIWAYKIQFCKNPEGLKVAGEVSPNYKIIRNDDLPNLEFDIEYSVPYHDLEFEHVWMLDNKHCENAVEDIWAIKVCYVDNPIESKVIGTTSPTLSLEYNDELPQLNYDIDYVIPYHDLAYEHVWMLHNKHCENAVEDIWAVKLKATDDIVGTKIVGEISPNYKIIYNSEIPKMEYDIDYIIPYHDLAYEHVWMLDEKHTKDLSERIWAVKIRLVDNIVGTKIVGDISPKMFYDINKDVRGYNLDIPQLDIQYYDLGYKQVYMLSKEYSANFDIWAIRLYHSKTKKEKYIDDIEPVQEVVYNPDLKNLKIKLDYKIPYHDRFYEHVWYLDEKFSNGEKIWAVKITASNKIAGEKEMGIVIPEIVDNLDVVFISYNEPNAEENWQRVLLKAPYAKRISGVKGIFEAHKAAAEIAKSDMFYVVDGDAWLVDDWNFDYQPGIFDRDCTYVWTSQNPINGLTYGYGGVKLFSKSRLIKIKKWETLDLFSTVSSKMKVMDKISNITKFDADAFTVWRSAFRECVKLSLNITNDVEIQNHRNRLNVWLTTDNNHPLGKFAVQAANEAVKFFEESNSTELNKINDYDWLREKFEKLNQIEKKKKFVEYDEFAKNMRDRLNAVSSSLCLAKWQQVSLHLPQGLTQSCYHPPTHKIPIESIKKKPSVLHNTPQKIEERKMMLNGERPEGCSYCWRVEDAKSDDPKGHLSDRHYRSSEWWSSPTFDEVVTNPHDYDVVPRYVEVNFNQACNFKCMYCSPHLSTTWEEEIKKYGGYQLDNGYVHNDLNSLEKNELMPLKIAQKENPYVTAFWEWWPDIYRKLRVFRMTGGEPLMDKNTFKVLDYVNENPHGQLELSITSNMCPPDQKLFDKFLEKIKLIETLRTYEDKENFNEYSGNHWYVDKGFKHFWLFVSLDGVGKQAEYMRTGLEYERMIHNVRTFLKETKYTTVSFINTFNLLSIPSLQQYLKMILELRKEFGGRAQTEFTISPEQTENEKKHGIVHKVYKQKKFQRVFFDIPILRFPDWLSIHNAGEYGIEEVEQCLKFMEENVQDKNYSETFEGFKPYEILKVKRDLAVMKEPLSAEQQLINRKNFYLFIKEFDKRRKTDFLSTFPELEFYYKQCMTAYMKRRG